MSNFGLLEFRWETKVQQYICTKKKHAQHQAPATMRMTNSFGE